MRNPAAIWLFPLLVAAGCEHQLRRPNNYPCASSEQCISGVCHGEICAAVDPGGLDAVCTDHGDCRSLRCVNGECASGERAGGQACRFHDECKSGRCAKDRTCELDTSPDSGPDGPRPDGPRSDGPRDKGPSPEKPGDKAGPKSEQVVKPDLPASDLLQKPDKGKPADLTKVDKPAKPADLPKPDKPAKPAGKLNYMITPTTITTSAFDVGSYSNKDPAVATGKDQWLVAWQEVKQHWLRKRIVRAYFHCQQTRKNLHL